MGCVDRKRQILQDIGDIDEFPIMLVANKCDLLENQFSIHMRASSYEHNVQYGIELLVDGYCKSTNELNFPMEVMHLCWKYCQIVPSNEELFAQKHGMDFMHVSAMKGTNVDKAFHQIMMRAYEYSKQQQQKYETEQ